MSFPMKRHLFILAVLFSTVAQSAAAECFADYKAKRDAGGLELHYGVIALNQPCGNKAAIEEEVRNRIAGDGWQLLRVMSSFERSKLQDKQPDAGDYFLRY